MKKIIISIALLITLISCNVLKDKTVKIPKEIIQNRIDKNFPITKNLLLTKLLLINPKIEFVEDKVNLELNYELSTLEGKNRGKIYISSNIKYNEKNEEVYLVGFSINKILNEKNEEVFNTKIDEILKILLENYLELTPVYKVREDNKNKIIKIKDIYIKDGNFYIKS